MDGNTQHPVHSFIKGGLELIISQTPYSMRGLLMGRVYGLLTLFAMLTVALSFPFTKMPVMESSAVVSGMHCYWG